MPLQSHIAPRGSQRPAAIAWRCTCCSEVRLALGKPMARIRVTGITREEALRGTPAPGAKTRKKRKPRTASKIRALKRARKAARCTQSAAGDASHQGDHVRIASGDGETPGTVCGTADEVEPTRAEVCSAHVTKTGENSDTIAAPRASVCTAQSVESGSTTWVCLICTYVNTEISAACTNCKCARSTSRMALATAATDSAAAATDQVSAVLDPSVPDNEVIYYPIFGKYYGRSRVTVSNGYATTKAKWNVARINNRRDGKFGHEYHVLWALNEVGIGKYYVKTWEPMEQLREDNFNDEMDLVDRWKASEIEHFEQFWKVDTYGSFLLGADGQNLCMFNALKRAAELAGRPDIITQQDIDDFVQDELKLNRVDLTEGATWKTVLRFLRRLRDNGHDFRYNALAKKNYSVPGRRGARVLQELDLVDGIYLVGAYNHSFVGHCVVLTVEGSKRTIYDSDNGKPISSAAHWINFYAFVRPFIVFE